MGTSETDKEDDEWAEAGGKMLNVESDTSGMLCFIPYTAEPPLHPPRFFFL